MGNDERILSIDPSDPDGYWWDGGPDALTQDECDAIGASGMDGRVYITESNVTPDERERLDAFRALSPASQAAFLGRND